ncbi:putative sodium-coupled neutral amino acid transporter 11 [Daphnia carinata]|uniref:putative sodium-coupled neutral amino acid transporter 11 n=1 Tax=Daphnia carinata TaxID=120202 RepID=UPI00257AD00E|nr:putative sodium-coupled neutral amino acid transporter 11 [Daphnia carinata]
MDASDATCEEETRHILSVESQHPHAKNEERKKDCSSLPAASFNYVNSIVGSGIIGMAFALNQAGILLGLILIIGLGMVTDYSLIILIRSSLISGTNSYQGVMKAAFGKVGYSVLSLLQFIYPFIAMISYNVIVGDTVTKVLMYYAGLESGNIWVRREVVIAIITLCLSLPLSLCDGMAKFARVSFISLVVTAFVLCAIIIRLFTLGPFVPQSDDAWVLAKPGITQAVAIASFAYMCHHSTFLLYGSLKQPTEARWARLTHVSVFTSALIEIFFALFGYATFTGFVQGDLLENYCRGDHLMNAARIMFCVTILLTAPIEGFVARDLIMSTLSVSSGNCDGSNAKTKFLPKIIVSFSLVTATCLISFSTDCLSIVLEFNGVFAAIPLAYILPALCYIRLEPSSWKTWHKLPAIMMAFFGILMSFSGLVMIFVNWGMNSSCSHGAEMSYCPLWVNATQTKF